MTSSTPTWLALFVGFGIGAFLASLISWFSAKAVIISNRRQNWINALRDDLVLYLKKVESVYDQSARLPSSLEDTDEEHLEKIRAAKESALLVYRRILVIPCESTFNTHAPTDNVGRAASSWTRMSCPTAFHRTPFGMDETG